MPWHSAYPNELRSGSSNSKAIFRLMPQFFALRGDIPTCIRRSLCLTIGEDGYAVYEDDPEKYQGEIDVQTALPVYALEPGGSLALATGRILIRFAEGIRVEDKETEIADLGYVIAERISYAPQAAWLTARNGSIARALWDVTHLYALAEVEHVEPQMVMESVPRR